MSFENVNSLCIYCPNKNNNLALLLENAIFWAEQGLGVWIITTEYVESLPVGWTQIPDRSVLKFMTFLFLPTINDLFEKIINVQYLSITPKIILVSHLDKYFENGDISTAAHCCAILMDAINICARKLNEISEDNFSTILNDIKNVYSS
ncbi:uncharacterized protein LOC123296131 [Chrysoperla carnea]|uniref:uncharacterized protein LOC123296131 n=1 Tax=Chrysoperla carnea TaxID=189513 RepID=UPI001D05C37B|nr:uncharacterized protein LOC123296131 [Chrysoperla carnea]